MRFSPFLLLFSWLLSGPVCAAPAPPTPLAGEIALEGTIESLDVVKNTVVLRATAFATTAGAAKKLPQPKIKAIQIGDATQFVESSGLKNLSLGDLEKGLPIRVVGKEVAGKSFAARVVAWRAPAPPIPLDPLTPRAVAPLLPPAQTQNGITLRIIDAGWMSLAQMWPQSQNSARPLFYFSYTLPGASDGGRNEQGWATSVAERNTRLLQVSGPKGEPVTVNSSGPLEREPGIYGGTRTAFSGVNPVWKFVVAEFETLDPSAARGASGEINSTLVFDKVPLPAKSGEKLAVGKTMTTARGTTVTLKTVRVGKHFAGDTDRTFFDFAVKSPPSIGDMKVELDLDSIKDENDTRWTYDGWGNSGFEFSVKALPPAGSKTLTVGIKIKESAPSLQKRGAYRQFRVEIPVAAFLKFKAPPANPPAPVLKAEGKAVSVEIERETHENTGNWGAMAWIQSRGNPADKTQRWLLREVKARARDKETRGSTYEDDNSRQFMRLNGAPAASDEHSQSLIVPFDLKRPDRFDLELKLEMARRLENFTSLRGVPLPARGASLDIKEGQFENDVLRVKRLFWFKSADELAGVSPGARGGFQNANLAVVVELLPVFPGASVEIPLHRATDDAKRELEVRQWTPRGDAGRAGTQNTNLRTLILPVSASSKSLDLWFHTLETAWSGQTETLILKDVAGK